MDRPIFDMWPRLRDSVPIAALGDWPSPVDPAPALAAAVDSVPERAWIKRDDLSSSVYGGNKVRTLEVLFGAAVADGAEVIYSTGAFGSNHALAAALHAPRAGLEPGAILFPQPYSACAVENAEASASLMTGPRLVALRHWSTLPLGMARVALRHRRGKMPDAHIMAPGGATPQGALGYVNAAFELARQVADGALPEPRSIVVGVGSTCTTAGLLVGTELAARAGLGFERAPDVVAVRVTPWPVTSRSRIAHLAARTSRHLAALVGDEALALSWGSLRARLRVDGRELGKGYGHRTDRGLEAIAAFQTHAGFDLDTTYSAKAGSGFLRALKASEGPVVYWSTKSTAALPRPDPDVLATAPAVLRTWLSKADRSRFAVG